MSTAGLLGLVVMLVGPDESVAAEGIDQLKDTRSALQMWVENQRIISEERRDLVLAKEMLNERIDVVQREIDLLREKIAEAQKSITEADKSREKLIKENEALKAAAAGLAERVVPLENRIRNVLQRLPDPIRERVKPLSQRLPEDPEQTKVSLSERYQNIVGILNEVNKFNREISVTSEVRQLPNGSSAEVTAMYIGIGQGYYVGANQTVAGIGRSAESGWTWEPINQAAARIAHAIAILNNEQVASFVSLPMEAE
jgi:FtsZ-binding cell division protein ZapB